VASLGEERGAGYGVGGVKETSMMAETDSEKKVLKLKMREEEKMT
jgi:hypothetical protein